MKDDLTRALRDATWLWVSASRHQAAPPEAAALISACGKCAALRTVVAHFSGPTYVGLSGLVEQAQGFLSGRLPPEVDASTWEQERRCPCGAPVHRLQPRVLRWMRFMHGSGAALLVDVEAEATTLWRLPLDGQPQPLAAEALAAQMGRPLDLTPSLRRATESGAAEPAAPGVWVVPPEAEPPTTLAEVGYAVEVSESWARLAKLEGQGPFGRILVEEDALLENLLGATRRFGAPAARRTSGSAPQAIEVQHAGLAFPFDARLTVRRMAERGATLQDAVAAELERTLARAEAGAAFVQAVQAARPQLEFRLEGTQLWAATGAQTKGWPLCLQTLPAAVKPGTEAFERELRFACDTPPDWSDTTRTCPCGAPAFLVRRLVCGEELAAFRRAHPGQEMATLETFGEGAHLSAAVVAIACDRHVRFIGEGDLQRWGLLGEALGARLEADAADAPFPLRAELIEHEGKRAILAHGHLVASCSLDDRWLSGLHQSAGAPLQASAGVWTVSPHTLCLFDGAFDAQTLAERMVDAALAAGFAETEETPFSLRRAVNLEVRPAGRFVPIGGEV